MLLDDFLTYRPGSDNSELRTFFLVSLFGVFVLAYFGIYNFIKAEIEQRELETTSLEQEMVT